MANVFVQTLVVLGRKMQNPVQATETVTNVVFPDTFA